MTVFAQSPEIFSIEEAGKITAVLCNPDSRRDSMVAVSARRNVALDADGISPQNSLDDSSPPSTSIELSQTGRTNCEAQSAVTSIVLLLLWCSPAHVAWSVMAIGINAIDGMLGAWPSPKFAIKVSEILEQKLNSSVRIVAMIPVGGLAAIYSRDEGFHFRRVAHSMRAPGMTVNESQRLTFDDANRGGCISGEFRSSPASTFAESGAHRRRIVIHSWQSPVVSADEAHRLAYDSAGRPIVLGRNFRFLATSALAISERLHGRIIH